MEVYVAHCVRYLPLNRLKAFDKISPMATPWANWNINNIKNALKGQYYFTSKGNFHHNQHHIHLKIFGIHLEIKWFYGVLFGCQYNVQPFLQPID